MESAPPGDAIPPAPQRAASARKGARRGTGAGSTRPHRPRPGHTGHGTLAARYGGRARPGEGQRLTPGAPHNGGRHPPGNALPPPPQRATPARKGARCGAGAGSTCPHRPHPGHAGRGTLAARSGGRAAREGTAPDTRRPSQRWKAPPPGTPFRHPHSEQRRPASATLWGRCRVHCPHRPRPGHAGRGTLAARSGGRAAGGGTAPNTGRPSQHWKAPPRGRPSTAPTPSNAPTHQRTSHGTSAPRPLLLDTAT